MKGIENDEEYLQYVVKIYFKSIFAQAHFMQN